MRPRPGVEKRRVPLWLNHEAVRFVWSAAAVSWMALIFYFSSRSPEALPAPKALAWFGSMQNIVAHLALFGVLGPLLLAACWTWMSGAAGQWRWVLLAAAMGALYGVLDEYHQSFVPGRKATLFDVAVDGAGIWLGLGGLQGAFLLISGLRQRRLSS